MSKQKPLFSASIILLLLMLLSIICTLPQNPNDPSNTSVNLLLRDSNGKTDNTLLEDTAGKNIQIGADLFLPDNLDSVELKITAEGNVVFDTIFKGFLPGNKDTIWKCITFYTAGNKLVTLTPHSSSLKLSSVSAIISIIGKQFAANHAPVVNTVGNTIILPGETCSLTLQLSDSDTDQTLSVAMSGNPSGSQLQDKSKFTWTAPVNFVGKDTIAFIVTDNGLPPQSDTAIVFITVTATPHSPIITVVGDRSLIPLATCSLTVRVSDEDPGQKLTTTMSGEPAGSKLTNDSTFIWTVPADFTGEKTVTFKVVDNGVPPLSDSTQVILSVSATPVNTAPHFDVEKLTVALNDTAKYTLQFSTICNDSDGDQISFSLSSGTPSGDTVIGTTYKFNATSALIGSYSVQIVASDLSGAKDTIVLDLNVTASSAVDNTPPSLDLVAPPKDTAIVTTPTCLVKVISTDASGIASVTARFNGTTVPLQLTGSQYTVSIGGLNTGVYNRVVLTATDASVAGNKCSLSVYIKYEPPVIDAKKPVLTRSSPAKDSTVFNTSSTIISIGANDESGIASVTASIGTTDLSVTGTAPVYSVAISNLVANQFTTVRFIATDASSNANKDTFFVTVKYDPTVTDNIAPIMSRKTPATDSISISSASTTIAILAKDASGIASVTCSFGSTSPVVTAADSVYSATVSGLVANQYNKIMFIATDASSTANKDTFFVTVKYDPTMTDNVAPVMKRKTPATDSMSISSASTTIAIVAKDASGIASVICNFGSVTPEVTAADSIFSATVSGLVANQYNKVMFIATDASSNANKDTFFVTVKYDPTMADNVPPIFTKVSGPVSGSTVITAAASFVYTITDISGVGNVFWTLNGTRMADLTPGVTGDYSISATLRSPPHANTITISAADNSANKNPGTETITLTYDLAPVATAQISLTTPRATALSGLLAATDPETDLLSGWTIASIPVHGTITTTSLPNFIYTPTGNYEGKDSLTFTVSDWTSTSAPAKIIITVLASNVAPIVTNLPATKSVNKGELAAFSATINPAVYPAPTIKWFKNSDEIGSASALSYSFTANQYSDSGLYKVKISNIAGADSAVCKLTVSDTTKPIVILVGSAAISVNQNGTWTDSGATATDDKDGSITPVKTGTPVNLAVPGVYTLTYTATDRAGNHSAVTRIVTVVPVWVLLDSKTPSSGGTSRFVLGPSDKLYFAEANADEIVLQTLNNNGIISMVSSFTGFPTNGVSLALGSDGSTLFAGTLQTLASSSNGTSWTVVDDTSGWNSVGGFGLNIGPGNRPYIAAMDNTFAKRVFRRNSPNWDVLGGNVEIPLSSGSGSANDFSFCITSSGAVFAIGKDYSSPGVEVSTANMNGTTWNIVALETTDETRYYNQITASGNTVYAASAKVDGDDPSVYRWVSSSWSKLPSMANSTTAIGGFNIACSPSNELFAAHGEGTNVIIKKYNGTSWVNVHQSGSSAAFTTTSGSKVQIIPGATKCYAVTTDYNNLAIWSLTY